MTESKLTHLDEEGQASMVDVTAKAVTERQAVASGSIHMNEQTMALLVSGEHKKGDVLAVARIAGIQAAKKCSDLIPLCHPLMLTSIKVEFEILESENMVKVTGTCKLAGQTGVEMEALTAVSVAALTIYDMCKAVDKAMRISDIQLLAKDGGKSGSWRA